MLWKVVAVTMEPLPYCCAVVRLVCRVQVGVTGLARLQGQQLIVYQEMGRLPPSLVSSAGWWIAGRYLTLTLIADANSYNALNTFHMFDLAGASGQSGSVFNEVLLLKQFSSEETMGGEACWLLAVRTTTHPSSYLGHLVSRGPSPPIIRPHEARFGSRHQEPRTMVTKCHGVYQPTLI